MTARLVFLGRLEDVAGTPDLDVEPGPLEALLAHYRIHSSPPERLFVELRETAARIDANGNWRGES